MSKNIKPQVIISFRLKCDSRKEAEAIYELYEAQITNFARFVRASSFEILLSKERRAYAVGGGE